jgi:uncharacterized membrane protein YfcA
MLLLLYSVFFIVGILCGLTGVGGVLIPPAIALLSDTPPHIAMGTALASFLPLGVIGTIIHCRLRHRDWNREWAVFFMLGGLMALPGALAGAHIHAAPLVILLASLVIFAGICTLRPPQAGSTDSIWQSRMGFFWIGAITSVLAGLTGAGGPVLTIPWMIVAGISPLTAVGYAMPYQVVTAASGTLGNYMSGHLDFALLIPLAALEATGFLLGIHFARRTPTMLLRKIIGFFCCALGLFLICRQAGVV